MNILLVDDNLDSLHGMQILMRLNGHKANTATNGEDALALAQAQAFDLILLDIGLPGISGYEVARRLRERGCPARLYAITGYGSAEDKACAHAAGFDGHFTKPIEYAALQKLLNGGS